MPRYPLSGITALSQLLIDADKNWAATGISNIKEVALGMVTGDIIFRGATGIQRLGLGAAGTQVKSKGPGKDPIWSYPDVLP